MSGISILNCIVLVMTIFHFDFTTAGSGETQLSTDARYKRNSPMWFGPRVGRKKRNPDLQKILITSDGNKDNLYDLDVDKQMPWVLIAFNDGKPYFSAANLIARSNRESGDEGMMEIIQQDLDLNVDERPKPPFVPRLGRQSSVYTPRLGRENENFPPVK